MPAPNLPAPNLPAPLSVTITNATVSLGNQPVTHAFAKPVQNYLGEPLFCHATSDGTILTLNINQQGPSSPPPAQSATIASITVTYNETPNPEHWDVQNIAYAANSPITLGMQVDPTWTTATLSIANAVQASTDSHISYVLVHDAADAATGEAEHYDLYWLSTNAMFDPATISGATFIPDGGGGMAGPFGISLP